MSETAQESGEIDPYQREPVDQRQYILAQSRAMGDLVREVATTSDDPKDSEASQFAFVAMFAHLNESMLKRMGVTLADYERVMHQEAHEIARHLEDLEYFAKQHGITLAKLIEILEARNGQFAQAVIKLKREKKWRHQHGDGDDLTLEELGLIVQTSLNRVNGNEVNLTCVYPAVISGNGEGPHLAYTEEELEGIRTDARPAVEVIHFPVRGRGTGSIRASA